jgi:signal transduction histidine kinase
MNKNIISEMIRRSGWKNFLLKSAVFIYLILALISLVITPFQASNWFRTPFMGRLLWPTLTFNSMTSVIQPSPWNEASPEITSRDTLIGIDGQKVTNSAEIQSILKQHRVNDLVQVEVRSAAGIEKEIQVRLIQFPFNDQVSYFFIPYLISWIYLGIGFWTFTIRRRASGLTFSIFAASAAISLATWFDLLTTQHFAGLWVISFALTGGSFLVFGLFFPGGDALIYRYKWLPAFGYLLGAAISAFTLTQLYRPGLPLADTLAWRIEVISVVVLAVIILVWIWIRRIRSASPIERDQARWVGIGGLISFIPLIVWMVGTLFYGENIIFSPFLILPMAIFPILVGYSIQRYRLLTTDQIFSKAVLYASLAVLITAGYSLLVSGLSLLLSTPVSTSSNPIIAGLVFFVLAILISPLRTWLESRLNAFFFRSDQANQQNLQNFGRELTSIVDLQDILKILYNTIDHSLHPTRTHIFYYDQISNQYIAAPGADKRPTSELRFSMTSALPSMLEEQRTSLFIADTERPPQNLQSEAARLRLLGTPVLVPLSGQKHLTGWIALGPRRTGEPYSTRELSFIEALADQASLAIERAQVVENMSRRMREMDVLTRVAQGVNVTLSLDDMLELVYAQITQIIPADDFHVLLIDPVENLPQFAFFVEKDERISKKEKIFIGAGQVLEQETIQQNRYLLTDDFTQECLSRGIVPLSEHIFAWMSVPLNTGAETLGAISLGLRIPGQTYTQQQVTLVQAIADQAAGAIVKVRLLNETERRARQLATLNDVTRQLTSTLDLELLLQNILQSAVDILNCEAGSLLLVDPQTDELVFRHTVGPVASDLINRRLPPGSGLVGKAVKTKKPVIVHNVQSSPEWFSKTDQQTGFLTQGLIVVPLQAKDTVVGVVEVINKRNQTSFSQDDQVLLSAFAAQAVIAMENARLYTMTDHALAARVEELSVMQRIDRELNTSLDTARAMRITLDWAMRQSGASAGLVGTTQEDGIRIMASQGYTEEIIPYQDAPMPVLSSGIQQAIESGQPQTIQLHPPESSGLLSNALNQIVVPIVRETHSIGLIFLESTASDPWPDELLDFLTRLGDHASIAISNAQFYSAVQSANLAKSEFVSFVSHELKNPMTSIKGYTDLLAAGAVGPVNEAQGGFLATIRANIERMNNLISDLNDVSKIEVGRMRLDFKAISMNDAVEEVARSTKRQIEEKEQLLDVQLPVTLPPVWADRYRLVQILVNLISNANKYTEKNGRIELSAEISENQWDPQGAPQVVHLWVKDNGIGIDEEDQKKIFQKFFRSEDPKTRDVPGTGLGLNITRSLVEMQGGRIWFESEFRKGTTFHITIPVAEK